MSTPPPPPANRPTEHVLWRGEVDGGKRPGTDRPGEILRLLSRAWRNLSLYGPNHRVAQTAIGDLHQFVTDVLSGRPSLRLFIQEDTFFEEERALLEESLRLYSLLTALTERRIRAIQVNAGVTPEELTDLIDVLGQTPEELERRGGSDAYLTACGVKHITVGSTIMAGTVVAGRPGAKGDVEKGGGGEGGEGRGEGGGGPRTRPVQAAPVKLDPQDAYRAGLRVMDELSYQASMNVPLNLTKARMVVNYFLDILDDERAALLGIAALKNYDEDTYHHSVNVCILSLLLGSQLNMDRALLALVGLAGLLHDIGKVRVPRNIITRPVNLTAEEMEIVKRHTIYGAHILRELPGLSQLAMVVAFEHHARYDLTGYPRITMKKIPHLVTRIVWVADCYDAMTTARRVYRAAKSVDQALKEILDGAGTVFDPVLAKLFGKYCRAFLTRPATGEGKSGEGKETPRVEPPGPPPPSAPAPPPA